MINPKMIAALLCGIVLSFTSYSQDSTFATTIFSKPTDLPLNGWNKTLMLHDGKTFVLHIAPWEKMSVKIFDTAHNEIAGIRQLFKVINEKALDECTFKGLYEINGYPVLFLEQVVNNYNALIRVSFNPNTGLIRDEIIMCDHESYNVSKCPHSENYAILHCYMGEQTAKLKVSYWNKLHEKFKEVIIDFPSQCEPYLINFLSFLYDSKVGTYAAFSVKMRSKKIQTGNNIVLAAGLQPTDSIFTTNLINFQHNAEIQYGLIQYNPFSGMIEIGVSCVYHLDVKKDYALKLQAIYLAILEKNSMAAQTVKQIAHGDGKNKFTDSSFKGQINGFPVRMITNKTGITTTISESILMGYNSHSNSNHQTLLGPLNIKKLDENGDEIFNSLVYKSQWLANNLYGNELAFRGTNKYLFREDPDQAYDNQFTSAECIVAQNNSYVIYNDYATNYFKKNDEIWDVVRKYDFSEAYCYKITSNNELKKSFLFGEPGIDESRALLVESMDIHSAENKFTALVSVRHGKEKHLCLAWCKLQ